MTSRKTAWGDSLLLVLLAVALIWPLFRLEYLGNRGSIESTFIADARMLGTQLPHPGWQPLWYCGTRFDYIYPPALRYGTALLSLAGHISTARAYHLYTGAFYVLGIVAVYWLVRVGSRSRGAAWLAAAGTALLSPSFVFLPVTRHDSPHLIPQRLHVLMAYGEGPHISALCIIGAALGASWLALRGGRLAFVALAGGLCALAVSTNFYGATALAISFPVLAWAVWNGERSAGVWLRAGGIVALAYGLCAFWLTPSYLRITVVNLRWVAEPGNTWSPGVAAIAVFIFCAASMRVAGRRADREWTVFLAGLAFFLSLNVLGYFYFGFHVTGDSQRLIPELDLALVLAFTEAIRLSWKRPGLRVPAAVVVVLAFVPAARYLRHAWSPFPAQGVSQWYEYRIAKWTREHLPGERVLPSGSVRFWFDAWDDNAQVDGGSLQGMINQMLPVAIWQIEQGKEPGPALLWLQALGADAVIVPDRSSPEVYHDYSDAHKFRGTAPVLYDDGAGTAIYRIPRVHPGIGRVVNVQALAAAGKLRGGDDSETLAKYVAAVEQPEQPLTRVTWADFDNVRVQATVAAGQAILLQESYDPAWRAEENGKALGIRREGLTGFMLMDVGPGRHDIRMRFETPLENRAGQVLFGMAALAIGGLVTVDVRGRRGATGYRGNTGSVPPAATRV